MPTSVHPAPFVIHPPADLLQKQPGLRQASQTLARHYAANHFVSDAAIKAVGQQLWQALAVTAE